MMKTSSLSLAFMLMALLLLAGLTGCQEGEEDAAESSPTSTPKASTDATESALATQATADSTALETLVPTPVPCATGDCSRIALSLAGPPTARLGDSVTYTLTYQVKGAQGTDVIVDWLDDAMAYESSSLQAGNGAIVGGSGYIRWSLGAGTGTLAVVLRLPDTTTASTVSVAAYEPGTRTTSSNVVTTSVEGR